MDEVFYLEEESDLETDYIVDPISEKEKSIAYGLYKKMILYQNHYNSVKAKYKRLAIGWFSAFFIGVGYVLLEKDKSLIVNDLIAITFLGVVSSIGIFLLCFFDVNIYHRLSESVYAACVNFENTYFSLGKTHKNMAKILIKGRISPVLFDGMFYCSITFVILLIANFSLSFYIFSEKKVIGIVVFFVILALIFLLDFLILYFSSKILSVTKHELEKAKNNT